MNKVGQRVSPATSVIFEKLESRKQKAEISAFQEGNAASSRHPASAVESACEAGRASVDVIERTVRHQVGFERGPVDKICRGLDREFVAALSVEPQGSLAKAGASEKDHAGTRGRKRFCGYRVIVEEHEIIPRRIWKVQVPNRIHISKRKLLAGRGYRLVGSQQSRVERGTPEVQCEVHRKRQRVCCAEAELHAGIHVLGSVQKITHVRQIRIEINDDQGLRLVVENLPLKKVELAVGRTHNAHKRRKFDERQICRIW